MAGFSNISGRTTMPVTTHLIIINVLMLLVTRILDARGLADLNTYLGLHYYDSPLCHLWQYVTYMFMHADFGHLFSNMFTLFMFGRLLEQVWGSGRFTVYYLVTGIGAAITQQVAWRFGVVDTELTRLQTLDPSLTYPGLLAQAPHYFDPLVTIGASGSVFGILLAFGMLFPNMMVFLLIPPMPLKVKWLVIGYGLFEFFAGIMPSGDGVAHFAHLGGMLFGLLLILWWRKEVRADF